MDKPKMLTSEERTLLQRHVTIDGDGNVVGNDNTVHVTKVNAETYVAEINNRWIKFTVEQLVNIKESQVGVVGDHTRVYGGMHFHQQAPSQSRGDAPPKHPHVYHNLPQPDYGEFVGRREELAQVHRVLRPYPHSRHPVVTIDGIGGIGKSALALEVAHRYLRDYDRLPDEERFDAIIWTSAKASVLTADGIAPRQQITRTLDDIYTAIAVTLEREAITRARPEGQDALVTKALTSQRTLLIVDNLETVDDERVSAFLRELPAPTKAIVTTRHRINVAYPIRLMGMAKEDALVLIGQECEEKGVALTKTESAKLYVRTGGVPLAMVWSVAQIGYGYSVDAVLQRLGEPTGDIARFCFEEVTSNIRGTPAYRLLVALSLCTNGASREALSYVTELPPWECEEALVSLEKLSLVNHKGDTFKSLPLTSEYVLQDLELGQSEINYWDFLVEHGPRLVEVMLETGDLQTQADFALWGVAWKLVLRGEYASAKAMIEQIASIAASQQLEEVQANAWFLLALLYREKKFYVKSLQWFERAERLFRDYNLLSSLAGLLNRKADALRKSGDLETAKECIEEAMKLLDVSSIELQQRLRRKTTLLGDLGATLSREGRYAEANGYLRQCIRNAESIPDLQKQDRLMACAYIEKAITTYHLQGLDEANEWALRAEERIVQSGVQRPISDGDEIWIGIQKAHSNTDKKD